MIKSLNSNSKKFNKELNKFLNLRIKNINLRNYKVFKIVDDVKKMGHNAVFNYEKKFDIELKSTDKSINVLENLEYKTIDEDGNGYLLKAKYGETLIDRQNTLLLKEVEGQINLKDKSTIYITSKYANYNKYNFDTNFFTNVVVVYEDSIAKSDNFDIFFSNNG